MKTNFSVVMNVSIDASDKIYGVNTDMIKNEILNSVSKNIFLRSKKTKNVVRRKLSVGEILVIGGSS